MHAFKSVIASAPALAILSTFVHGAAVQTTSGVQPGYPNDACIISCIAQAASAANCATYADLPCVCASALYQTAATACLSKNCTVPEYTLAQTLHADQCAYENAISGLSVAASTFRAGASSVYVSDSAEASSLSSAYSSYGSYLSSAYSAYGASLSSEYSALGSSLSTQFVGTGGAGRSSTPSATSTASAGTSTTTGSAGGDNTTSGAGKSARTGGSVAALSFGVVFTLATLLV